MKEPIKLKAMNEMIQSMKKIAQDLYEAGEDFPALKRNGYRILSSIKMLEINISDIIEFQKQE